jgi:hypothetical protein
MVNPHYDTRDAFARPGRSDPAFLPGRIVRRQTSVNQPPAVPTARVAVRRPGSRRVAIVAAVIVVVTVIRPWGASIPPATAPAPHVPDGADLAAAATAGPDPSPAPSLLPDEIACSPGGWTVVSLDRMGSWTVRSWVPAQAVLADGPLDPRVQRLTLESPEVLAIGACSPSSVDGSGATVSGGPARFVRAWRIETGRATPVDLRVRRAERLPSVATLYRPSDAAATAASPAHWPAGVYVLELALASGVEQVAGGPGSPAGWFVSLVVRGPG